LRNLLTPKEKKLRAELEEILRSRKIDYNFNLYTVTSAIADLELAMIRRP